MSIRCIKYCQDKQGSVTRRIFSTTQHMHALSVHQLCLFLCIKSASLNAFAKEQGTELPSKLLKDWDLLQVLHPGWAITTADLCQFLVQSHQLVHVCPELWRLTVRHLQHAQLLQEHNFRYKQVKYKCGLQSCGVRSKIRSKCGKGHPNSIFG